MKGAIMAARVGTLLRVGRQRGPRGPKTARQRPLNGMPTIHAKAPVAVPLGGRKQVVFRFAAEPGSAVYLAGTFNDWEPERIKLEEAGGRGVYQKALRLPQGKHEYKFIVNGVWCVDPDCRDWVANQLGTLNSVVEV